jgi:hypothetical protein
MKEGRSSPAVDILKSMKTITSLETLALLCNPDGHQFLDVCGLHSFRRLITGQHLIP